jgi:hypothetical protein
MKLDALDHPKTFDFCARLGVELPTALGHLELLWAFTGKKAPQGNIGKWPDGAIARACYWMGPPDSFIQALLLSGFIDADPEHRLTVHDWHAHAPGWVRAKLKKIDAPFIATLEPSSERSSDGSSEATKSTSVPSSEPSSRAPVPKGREGKGREGKSKKDSSTSSPDDLPAPDPVQLVFDHWRRVYDHPRSKLDPKRRKVIQRALTLYPPDVLCEAIAGYRNSAFHMGDNDQHRKFDDVELFLRDAKHIDAGLAFGRTTPHPQLSALTRKNIANTDGWVPPEMRRAAG